MTGSDSIYSVVTEAGVMYKTGLTVREHFAAMAMLGLCANGSFTTGGSQAVTGSVEFSVQIADALIAELNKK